MPRVRFWRRTSRRRGRSDDVRLASRLNE